MVKKFDVVDLDDEKAGKFAEVMSNKTSKKIFNHLKKNKSSATEVSKDLNLPLSTVHYNIQKLSESGLVKVHDYYWSPKGNKVNIYSTSDRAMVFTPKKSRPLENYLMATLSILLISAVTLTIALYPSSQIHQTTDGNLLRFESEQALVEAIEGDTGVLDKGIEAMEAVASGGPMINSQLSASDSSGRSAGSGSSDYSETNVQVQGVDEADIIKTDGKYIYTVSQNKLIIADAFPGEDAEILYNEELDNFSPREMFLDDDKLLIFGSVGRYYGYKVYEEDGDSESKSILPPNVYSAVSVQLYDISDREDPELIRTTSFEGDYVTSRKIDTDVYFVVNSYPRYTGGGGCGDIVPMFADKGGSRGPMADDYKPTCPCTRIGYIEEIEARNFLTLASISMEDENKEIEKETILGNGRNVYASKENIYIAQTQRSRYSYGSSNEQKTLITKFSLDDGDIEFVGSGAVKGNILNQFSMDEYDDHFRIATTSGSMWGKGEQLSSNNVYVLDEDLDVVGTLEDLAPGERIYSVRFMGKRGYVVTFKKVDPLFVIDLENHRNPTVLGKLKIPGYSDYLHPYDETHIIGIGKDTVEAEESLKDQRNMDFAWYQGIKMAIFDVSDVENPIEMHKVIIGDRGTESEALHNHKAFLFDREKELLVIPITLAEIQGERSRDNQRGEFTFQGAYVYNINLEDGFDLRGRVTHHDDNETFLKSGYYYRDYSSQIQRSLYISDILYTLSNSRLQLNDLDSLERIKALEF